MTSYKKNLLVRSFATLFLTSTLLPSLMILATFEGQKREIGLLWGVNRTPEKDL